MAVAEASTLNVVLGVCGGVAAYKSVELMRQLVDAGAFVTPILTANAERFVGRATFDALASSTTRTSLWDAPEPSPHTTLGQAADVVVVAPATARLIASYAHGLSDDLLATTLLATRAPVVLAPAMHTEMWENPAVQANIELLRQRGVTIVEPESGHLAGGDVGVGRLASVSSISKTVLSVRNQDLACTTVVVTAGGTREPIDPVRYLGNHSSGKQGHALAEVARNQGARVILVTASMMQPPAGVQVVKVNTAQDMHDAVMHHLPEADVLIMAAAVADFRPTETAANKIKKSTGLKKITLEPTLDILQVVSKKRRKDQVVVGFAAETENVEANAKDKLKRKKLDLIVANNVTTEGVGFGTPTNQVNIYDKNGPILQTDVIEKRTVAANLLNCVVDLLRQRR